VIKEIASTSCASLDRSDRFDVHNLLETEAIRNLITRVEIFDVNSSSCKVVATTIRVFPDLNFLLKPSVRALGFIPMEQMHQHRFIQFWSRHYRGSDRRHENQKSVTSHQNSPIA